MHAVHDEAAALYEEGRYAEAEALLRAQLDASPSDDKARRGLERLLFLQGKTPEPADAVAAVAQARALAGALGPARVQGRDEGVRLQRAADLLLRYSPAFPDHARPTAARILWRAGRYAEAEAIGEAAGLGRLAAAQGDPMTMLSLTARMSGEAGRHEAAAWRRIWAAGLEARAAADPLPPRPSRSADPSRLRLGFLSSDLRAHVVGYFVQPLFQFRDPRFDVYVYTSWPGPADAVHEWFAARSTIRRLPADDRAAAALIAEDELDLLVEIGGPTAHNRPGVVAFRPAPLQASWLGYPASLAMDAIDYLIADAQLIGGRADLITETPLILPDTWLTMAPAAFPAAPAPAPEPPVRRNGYVTFGTANDPYKISPHVLRVWARIVSASPGAHFMIVRPEAGAPCFRQSVLGHFAEAGVGPDRLDFRPLRGAVRPLYADIDIALDPFPLTGGTTTCDALWMGVPTVTLAGQAIYERLSAAILTHAGFGDLVAQSLEDYQRIALRWAQAPERLATFRSGIRDIIRSRPLGQPDRFAAGFFNTVAAAIAAKAEAARDPAPVQNAAPPIDPPGAAH